MHIGKRIEKVRKTQDVSHADFKGFITKGELKNIESGRLLPEAETLHVLAKRFQVPDKYFFDYYTDDSDLEAKLAALRKLLDSFNIDNAAEVLEDLEFEYPYIPSLTREVQFLLLKTQYYIKNNEIDKAIKHYEQDVLSLVGVDENKIPFEIRELFYDTRGLVYFYQDNFVLSTESFLKQIENATKVTNSGRSYYNVALSFFYLNDLSSALKYGDKAITIYLREHEWKKAGDAYNLLGLVCLEQNESDKGLQYFYKALALSEKLDLQDVKVMSLNHIGIAYQKQGNYAKSLDYLYQNLELRKKYKDRKDTLVRAYTSIIDVYIKQKNLSKIKQLSVEAKQYCENEIDKYILQLREAQIYYFRKKYDQYEELMSETIDFLYENEVWAVIHNLNLVDHLIDYYEKNENYKQANKYLKVVLDMKIKKEGVS